VVCVLLEFLAFGISGICLVLLESIGIGWLFERECTGCRQSQSVLGVGVACGVLTAFGTWYLKSYQRSTAGGSGTWHLGGVQVQGVALDFCSMCGAGSRQRHEDHAGPPGHYCVYLRGLP
jgi:hypothetical protein